MTEIHIKYIVKKGPADPFRGDWYTDEEQFDELEKAVEQAATLTIADHNNYLTSWEQYGYEWSVFERLVDSERKIWEGYKFIMNSGHINNDLSLGKM